MSYKIIAQALMEPGLKIVNTIWKEDYPNAYIYFDENTKKWFDEGHNKYIIDCDEYSEKWEIYQEKPKLREVELRFYVAKHGGDVLMTTANSDRVNNPLWTPLYSAKGEIIKETYLVEE